MYFSNMRWFLVVLLSFIPTYSVAVKRPSWLKPCSRKDPNFGACALESAHYAIPFLLNGDRKLGLPSFNPFKISQVDLFGQETFKLKLKDLEIHGLDKIQPVEFKVDFDKRKATVKTFVPEINILGDYEIDGRVLFLPLKGSGPCKLSLVDGTYDYGFTFELETRDGVEYARINDALSTFEYDVKKVMFNLENLFNGDKRLGEETNKLLNDSWKELNEELKESVIQTLRTVYGELAKKIYEKVPLNDIVLP